MNIEIVRTFVLLRKIAANYTEIMKKLDELEKNYDGRFREIHTTLNYLIDPPEEPKKSIGFKRSDEVSNRMRKK